MEMIMSTLLRLLRTFRPDGGKKLLVSHANLEEARQGVIKKLHPSNIFLINNFLMRSITVDMAENRMLTFYTQF